MSENIQESKMSKYSESAVRQLCLKQDIAAVFTIEYKDGWIKEEGDEPIDVIAVFDGHGTDFVIDTIRNLDLQEHFTKSDTAESIQKNIDMKIEKNNNLFYNTSNNYKKCITHRNKKLYERSSGATLSSVYICRNFKTNKIKIQAEWLGDSPIFVFVNGECIFNSDLHNTSNENELNYIKNKGIPFKVENIETGFEVVSENKIMYKPGKYIIFEKLNCLIRRRTERRKQRKTARRRRNRTNFFKINSRGTD
jgi:serine/threonine protein phosphatase PrpC